MSTRSWNVIYDPQTNTFSYDPPINDETIAVTEWQTLLFYATSGLKYDSDPIDWDGTRPADIKQSISNDYMILKLEDAHVLPDNASFRLAFNYNGSTERILTPDPVIVNVTRR